MMLIAGIALAALLLFAVLALAADTIGIIDAIGYMVAALVFAGLVVLATYLIYEGAGAAL